MLPHNPAEKVSILTLTGIINRIPTKSIATNL